MTVTSTPKNDVEHVSPVRVSMRTSFAAMSAVRSTLFIG